MALDVTGIRRCAVALVAGGVLYAASPVHPPIPCPLRSLTGIPCPLCGMTRAVTAAFRFDFIGSLRFNPAGLLIIAVAAWALITLRKRPQLAIPVWIPVATIALMWAWNLTLNPTFT